MDGDKLFTNEGLTVFLAETQINALQLKTMTKEFFNLPTGATINSEILEFQGKEIQDDVMLEQKQTSYKYTMNLSTPATMKKKQMKEKRELLNKKP
jgi:dihydroorotate dehydrogenase